VVLQKPSGFPSGLSALDPKRTLKDLFGWWAQEDLRELPTLARSCRNRAKWTASNFDSYDISKLVLRYESSPEKR